MMGRRHKMISVDECDAFTGWRRVLFWKAGQRKRIKKRYNKRMRQLFRRRRSDADKN